MQKNHLKWTIGVITIFIFALNIDLITKATGFIPSLNRQSRPIASPIPTASPTTNSIKRIQYLMTSDLDCKLPCFMGLETGKSTTDDIKKLVEKFDYSRIISSQFNGKSPYNFSLSPNKNGLLIMGLFTKSDILQRIRIGITDPRSWLSKNIFDLPNAINELGVPENVYMGFSGRPLGFMMVLVYNSKGVLIRYQATYKRVVKDNKQPLEICFDPDTIDLYQVDVWMQNPESDGLVEDNQPDLHDSDRETRPFWSLEKATGINELEFAQFFTNTPDNCMTGFSPDKLRQDGYVY